jgi:predicted transposase YdaD
MDEGAIAARGATSVFKERRSQRHWEGHLEGRQEGRQEEYKERLQQLRKIVLKLLSRRFGRSRRLPPQR